MRPVKRPLAMTGRRRMPFSFIRWMASMMEADWSMVTGFLVIHASTEVIACSSQAQEGLLDVVVAQQLVALAREHDPPGFHDVGSVGDAERLVDVLFALRTGDH